MRNKAVMGLRSLVLLAVACYLFLPLHTLGQQGGTARYLYDDNGRLIAVLLPNGEASLYNYDAAGNLLSISRQLSTVLLLIDFTPKVGVAGNSVSIYGTGFSPTTSANDVSFNGLPAVVTSSSQTEIIATVPAGVSTGPISVTTPLGNATTTAVFTVVEPPAVTGFTPSGGAPGTSVTISGINFEIFPRESEVKFNGVTAVTSSVTATEIVAAVPPSATTGRVSVTTSAGTATSDQDFFVPPANYPNVTAGGPIAFGEIKTFNLGAGKAALYSFEGTAGQSVSINLFNIGGGFFAEISLIAPDESLLVPPTLIDFIYRGRFIEPQVLPATGTYKIFVDNSRFNGGGLASLQIFDVPADATGTIVFPGETEISNSVPGQNARVTFNGTAGDRVNITGTLVPIGNFEAGAYLSVFAPNGSLLGSRFMSRTSVFGQQPAFFGDLLLPSDGTYSLLIDPTNADLVTATVSVTGPPPDVVTTIVPGGDPVTVTTVIGQNARVTFDGIAGQRVSLEFSNVFLTVAKVSILDTNNGTLVYDYIYYGGSVRFFEPLTLQTTGTYTIYVDPLETYAGSMILTLHDVQPDVSASLTVGGPPLTVPIVSPGQNAEVTFTGIAGQRVSLNITDINLFTYVTIYNPSGWSETEGQVSFGGRLFSNILLSESGTYRIVLNPYAQYTGSMTLSLFDYNQPEITGTITSDGTPLDLNFPQAEQNARISFAATAGQKLILNLTNVTVPRSRVTLFLPNGSTFSGPTLVTNPGRPVAFEGLPVTGTYNVLVDPESAYTGSMRLTLTEVVDVTGSFTINGPAVTVTTTAIQNARLTFSGTAAQRVFLTFSDVTMSARVSILNPDGSTLADNIQIGGNEFGLDVQTLPTTGTYTLLIDPNEFDAGTITIQATETGGLTVSGASVTTVATTSQESAPLTFSGTGGQTVHLFAFDNTIPSGTLRIYRPDGTLLTSSALTSIFNLTLPATGSYSITITPASGNTGRITLSLSAAGGGSS